MYISLNAVFLVIASGLMGLCMGSFLNLLIHRLPQMLLSNANSNADPDPDTSAPDLGICWPASHCVHCLHPLRWHENIPLISFMGLRGRCGHCTKRISWRYPLVELLSAIWLVSCATKWGLSATAMFNASAGLCLIALAFIDAEHMLLPDALTQPLLWGGLLSACSGWTETHPEQAILGATLGYALLAAPAAIYRWRTGVIGLGEGDAKLLAAIGAWQGFMAPPAVLMVAGFSSVLWMVCLRWPGGMRQTPYPFGPWLALTSMVGCLWAA